MSRYEVQIECKACREGMHQICSGKRLWNNHTSDSIVSIRCTCDYCKERRDIE